MVAFPPARVGLAGAVLPHAYVKQRIAASRHENYSRSKSCGLPLVFAHLVGGQDEVVFEGRSFAIQADGALAGRALSFEESLFAVDVLRNPGAGLYLAAAYAPTRSLEADLWDALVLGVRDYLGKNGFKGAILGLSGGIDSALVLAIAVDAIGADKIHAVMMPSPYTADISWIDSRDMVKRLNVRYDEISIAPLFDGFKLALSAQFEGLKEDTTEENIQARVRGTLAAARGAFVRHECGRSHASDGHRLAQAQIARPEGAKGMPGVIVPRKTVGELRKLLDDDDAQIAVSVSETKIRFATPGVSLTSKVIDGTFPDYSRVIPTGNTRRLEVDAAEFAKAVDRVATVSSERSRAVKLTLEDDRLILSVNAPDSGAAEEELAVAYDAERLEIGFNAKYLLEIAGQVDRENAVFLFNTSGDPTLMREGNDMSATYVVMPMRV